MTNQERDALRRRERTGRPLGSEGFVADMETRLGQPSRAQKPGRKPKAGKG